MAIISQANQKAEMHSDTYVIMPVYNEASVIGGVLGDLLKHFANVICVNDGSTDDSAREIAKTKAQLLNHPINVGAGAATQTGIDYALQDPKAEYFITIDADGQHAVDDALKMLEFLKQNPVDIVLGSRFLGTIENISFVKKQFLKVASSFSRATTGIRLTDPHIGLRAFNRQFAENLKLTMPGFEHASEMVNRIAEGKFRYIEVPITVTYSDYTKAKGQSMLNAVNITVDLLVNRTGKK